MCQSEDGWGQSVTSALISENWLWFVSVVIWCCPSFVQRFVSLVTGIPQAVASHAAAWLRKQCPALHWSLSFGSAVTSVAAGWAGSRNKLQFLLLAALLLWLTMGREHWGVSRHAVWSGGPPALQCVGLCLGAVWCCSEYPSAGGSSQQARSSVLVSSCGFISSSFTVPCVLPAVLGNVYNSATIWCFKVGSDPGCFQRFAYHLLSQGECHQPIV